jgi:hypothetical protein
MNIITNKLYQIKTDLKCVTLSDDNIINIIKLIRSILRVAYPKQYDRDGKKLEALALDLKIIPSIKTKLPNYVYNLVRPFFPDITIKKLELLDIYGKNILEEANNFKRIDVDRRYDFISKIEWDRGDFGDGGSCYWGCNTEARKLINSNHHLYGLRLFRPSNSGKWYNGTLTGAGRCWIYRALINRVPVLFIFNARGPRLMEMASILAKHFNKSFKVVKLHNRGATSGILYIDGGTGIAIGPPQIVDKIISYDLQVKTSRDRAGIGILTANGLPNGVFPLADMPF